MVQGQRAGQIQGRVAADFAKVGAALLGVSLFMWDLIQAPSWTGLDNYLGLFSFDPLFVSP